MRKILALTLITFISVQAFAQKRKYSNVFSIRLDFEKK